MKKKLIKFTQISRTVWTFAKAALPKNWNQSKYWKLSPMLKRLI